MGEMKKQNHSLRIEVELTKTDENKWGCRATSLFSVGRWKFNVQRSVVLLIPFSLVAMVPNFAVAAVDPDELYRQGQFAEAEKIYAQKDMDNPKDIRFRYNRGCSAYQNGDFQAASAAFSSALRRSRDRDTRFRAAYNLGNTAFKQGDFQAAIDHYKEAIIQNPESEDARHNLELSLRAFEKQKKQQEEQKHQSDQEQGKEGKDPKSDQEQKKEGKEQSKGEDDSEKKQESKSAEKEQEKSQPEKQAAQSPQEKKDEKDLSGELKPSQPLQPQEEAKQQEGDPQAMMDKKKAEALLDNIQEDRSLFLRFQVPEEKRRGVASGRDW